MTLKDMAEGIAAAVGLPDAKTEQRVRGWIRDRYVLAWQTKLWREALALHSMAVPAGRTHVVMPVQSEAVLAAAWDRCGLAASNESFALTQQAEQLFETGTPAQIMDVGRVGLPVDDLAGSVLELVSDDAGDTQAQVTVTGERDSRPVRERLQLNGDSAVTTARAYDLVRTLSKTATAGAVTVRKQGTSEPLAVLAPEEREHHYARVRLVPPPKNDGTLLVLLKRRCPVLAGDSDVLELRSILPAVRALAMADALQWLRQYAAAQEKIAEGNALLEAAAAQDTWQPLVRQQVVPFGGVGNPTPW
ncbi:MAG: hypothetical protein D6781_02280 [Verrucomicrobia bacterium]|nr:MAG: hypothetical protein D6781_02280 [Verrucomicrobiota bacterium]